MIKFGVNSREDGDYLIKCFTIFVEKNLSGVEKRKAEYAIVRYLQAKSDKQREEILLHLDEDYKLHKIMDDVRESERKSMEEPSRRSFDEIVKVDVPFDADDCLIRGRQLYEYVKRENGYVDDDLRGELIYAVKRKIEDNFFRKVGKMSDSKLISFLDLDELANIMNVLDNI